MAAKQPKPGSRKVRRYADGGLLDDPLSPKTSANPLTAIDQKIAMGNAEAGLSNTERYQLANPTNAAYTVGGRGGIGSVAPASSAQASMDARQNDILGTVRNNLAAQLPATKPEAPAVKQGIASGLPNLGTGSGFRNNTPAETGREWKPVTAPALATQSIAQGLPAASVGSLSSPASRSMAGIKRVGNSFSQELPVAGFANGGKIKGPGTPTSDSIPAKVEDTGEQIKVSTGERIVSKAQDDYLQQMARDMGFDSLDAMLEHGTGQPVGPTVKGGQRAAANGMGFELTDPDTDGRRKYGPDAGAAFVYRGDVQNPVAQQVATPSPQAPQGIGDLPPSGTSVATSKTPAQGSGQGIASGVTFSPQSKTITWNDKDFDPKKEDFAPGAGALAVTSGKDIGKNIAILPQQFTATDGTPTNDWTKTDRYAQAIGVNNRMANLAEQMKRERIERDAYDPSITDNNVRANARQQLGEMDRRAAHQGEAQGRLLENQIKQTKLNTDSQLGNLQSAYVAEKDTARRNELATQIRNFMGKGYDGSTTSAQQAHNTEIDAARLAIEGLSPEDLKRRTANFTATGRENPDFDPTLENALKLSSRRKVGNDPQFDNRLSRQPAPQQSDSASRFKADPSMAGHRLGNQTDKGTEVFDRSGRLIGHYR